MPGAQGGRKKSVSLRRPSETTERDEFEDWMQAKATIKPDDQLQLTDQELKEEFTRILTATNPHAPQNIVRYNFKERQYKPIPSVDQLAIHFTMEGNLIHKESDEAKRQMVRQQGISPEEEEEESFEEEVDEGVGEEEGENPSAAQEAEGEGGAADGEEGEKMVEKKAKPAKTKRKKGGAGDKKLMNQFNFCERASQTYNNPLRERGTETEPPPRTTFSSNATQWIIFDNYMEDYEKQQEKNREKKPASTFGQKQEDKNRRKAHAMDNQGHDFAKIGAPMKIVERMVNQNTFDEISHDFKYYEDPSDEYRDQTGTLLPLWRFQFEKTRKMAVTALVWSNKYYDLYAVGHGSYDFQKQGKGMICFYTLKNPSYPEYTFSTESGVMCLDLHPEYPQMLCAGYYDGSVAVFNITQHKRDPLFISTAKNGKHTDPVWQVKWQQNDLDSNMNFFSVSADGRVTGWTLVKNDLMHNDVIILKVKEESLEGPDGARLVTYGSGTTLDFHRVTDHLFIVGTEEGLVHKCSKAYSSQFLDTFEAHHMAVYKVAWNPFHPDIFITCSADWSVKIWDHHKNGEPLFVFDLGSPVGDVAWSPYSSTIFAAVNSDGKVFIFDLNVNKYEPLCEQVVAQKKKTKLTHVAFNPMHPIIIVGDDRGHTACFKLSPNLRKLPKEKKGAESNKGPEVEVQKLDKILALVG
jgi:dynein intermediate chain 1, axonemal